MTEQGAGQRRYVAFISYSRADEAWARWLQRALERYRVPERLRDSRDGRLPRRLFPVFRDRDELPSSGDLGAAIESALVRSDALIVICSPAAAASRWVNEEIRRFRRGDHGERVFCLLVAGRPEVAAEIGAFPPALLERGGGAPAPEPLAADLTEGGDGRRGALQKLLAGLLGVGVDELRRRDSQRQARVGIAVAAIASAVAVVTLGLAIAAMLARRESELRREQAEGLIGFMLGELRGKLEPIGRLDLLDSVGDQAMRYFAVLGDNGGEADLLARAMALRQIGEVRLGQGRLEPALAAFVESRRLAERLFDVDASNDRHLFELGQAEFWVGMVAWDQNRLDAAEASMERYLKLSSELLHRAPDDPDYQRELSYAYSNLGSIARERSRPGDALEYFRDGARIEAALLADAPDDAALRFALAESWSWQGTCLMDLARIDESSTAFAEAMGHLAALHASGAHRRHSEEYGDVGLLFANVLMHRGEVAAARQMLDQSRRVYEQLADHDPANAAWQRGVHFSRRMLAELDLATGSSPPASDLAAMRAGFARLAAADPSSGRYAQDLALTERLIALVALGADDAPAALSAARRAEALIARVDAVEGRGSARQNAALVEETLGDALAAVGQSERAVEVWRAARLRIGLADGATLVERAAIARLESRLSNAPAAADAHRGLLAAGFADPRYPAVLPGAT
jgi:tetratricopeptide (TPR) repeat protein